MRTLFLLLLLANVGFFAWDRYLRPTVDAQARIQQVQMTPEKIRIVTPSAQRIAAAAPAASVPPPVAPVAPAMVVDAAACLQWGAFIGPETARADASVAELGLPAARVRRVATDMNGYWVLIPPRNSKAEADKAAETLKGLGIGDYSVVVDLPRWRNAISLGIFRTEEAAQNHLTAMRQKGATDAVMELRENFFRQVVIYIREPNEALVAKLAMLRANMPGSEVKAVTCPAP